LKYGSINILENSQPVHVCNVIAVPLPLHRTIEIILIFFPVRQSALRLYWYSIYITICLREEGVTVFLVQRMEKAFNGTAFIST
jgi:hypothetical protein